MPTSTAISTIYDFERVFELALKNVFAAAEVKAFTSQFVPRQASNGSDDATALAADALAEAAGFELLDFQLDRPRVEIFMTLGAGQQRFIPHPVTGLETETCWSFAYKLNVLTAADMRMHSAFRTSVRYILNSIRGTLNGTDPMTYHSLNFITDAGSSPTIESDKGDFLTILNYNGELSVQADAWALLTAA